MPRMGYSEFWCRLAVKQQIIASVTKSFNYLTIRYAQESYVEQDTDTTVKG